MGGIPILLKDLKAGPKVHFFVLYPDFLSNIVPVKIDCAFSQIQERRYLFCGFSLLYQICYLNLCRREAQVFGGQFGQKWRDNFVHI